MKIQRLALLLAAFGFIVSMTPEVQAQGIGGTGVNDSRLYRQGGYYDYSIPGDITIAVNVWGNVRFPGYYILKEGTNLNQALSFSGSSQESALLSSRRSRSTIIQVSRVDASGGRSVVYEAELRDMVSADNVPVIQNDDVILVEVIERERLNWRDLLPVASLGLTVANLIVNLTR